MIYQIDYDLRQPGRNYEPLFAAIRALGTAKRPLRSTWVVDTQLTAVQARDRLLAHMDTNDGLLVTRLSGEAAWYGLDQDVSQWLRDRLAHAA